MGEDRAGTDARLRCFTAASRALRALDDSDLAGLSATALVHRLWPGWNLVHRPTPSRPWYIGRREGGWLAVRHPSAPRYLRGSADLEKRWGATGGAARRGAMRRVLATVVVEPTAVALVESLAGAALTGGGLRNRIEAAAVEAVLSVPDPEVGAVRTLLALGGLPEVARFAEGRAGRN